MAFDKTITCTIVDDSDKDNGRYRVTDGSSKFIAYSETKTFRNKDIVYVTIPKGDFGEQKVIIGKKTEVEKEPFNYVRPFDNFLPCTNNIWENIDFDGLTAAGRDENITPQASELEKSFEDFENHYKGFTHLGIKANFKSLLAAEQIASGNYGIRLEMKCVVKDVHPTGEYQYILVTSTEEEKVEQYYIWNETDKRYEATTATPDNNKNNLTLYKQSEHKTIKKIFDLSCQDMLGNPFAFEIFSNQEKVFDISDIEDILALDIYFYQNGEFKTKIGKDLPIAKIANLFVSDINILFGYSLQDIDDEFVQLFTTDSLNYQHTNDIEENRKNIDLRWAHKVGDKLQVFTKDNLEAWYDEIFDRNEQDNTPYELLIDSSPQQIENRHYYTPKPETDFNRFYIWHGQENIENYKNGVIYSLTSFVPVTDIKKGEQYFKKQMFLISDFIKNNYFFSGSEDKRQLDDNLLNYDAKVYEKQKDFVTKTFIKDVKNKKRKLSDYIFYLYGQDNSISSVGINTVEEFLPNKRYCFDTYEEKENFNFENILKENQNYYISLYCPIDFNKIENEDKINNRIVKPLFSQRILNGQETSIENFYTINTNIFKEVDFDTIEYEPNKYYYRKYKLDEMFEIRWYRYNLGVPAADEFCGLYWERIPECSEGSNKTYTDPGETPFHCSLLPDFLYNKTEQIKAVLIVKQGDEQTPYYSNVITFENKNEVVNIPTTEQELALKLRINDGTFGNYYLYDESNSLIDKSQSSIRRSLTALFNKTDFTSNSVLQDATKVTWVFPIENTMLNINIAETGGTYIKPEPGSAYGKIVIEEKRNSYQLIYNIENAFSFNKNNNSITCTIEKDGEIFSTTQGFSFGNSGSNGSDYTLVLDLLTADNMVTLDPISNIYSFREVQQSAQVDFENYFVYDENTGYLRKPTGEYNKDIKYYICTSKNSDGNNAVLAKEYLTLEEAYKNSDIEIFNEDGTIKDLAITIFKLEDNVYTPITNFSEITNKNNNWKKNYFIANNLEMLYGYYYSKDSDGKKEEAFKILKTSTPVEEIKVRATLYDQSNNKVNLNLNDYTFEWSFNNDKITQGEYEQKLFNINKTENKNEIILLKRQNIDNAINSLCILTATLSGFGSYNLEAYLPIPLRANYGVIRYQGPDKIIYSTTGVPNYYKDEINLFYNDIDGNNINYPIFNNNTKCFSILDNEEGKDLVPTLEVKEETNGISYIKLIPKSTYIQGLKPFGIQYTDTQQTKIFTQPILNIQNRYFSSTLNKWDGELSVDGNKNTILAKMIGAGRKNKDNTFSGVMLGDWTGSVDANDGGKLSLKEHIGLYGIHKGETSFGFTEQGIGFIGKAGKGRILLDGDNSVITSSNWTLDGKYNTHEGLYMKIDDGFILMRDKKSHYIKLDVLAPGNINKDDGRISSPIPSPTPGGKDSEFPFVIYGDKDNFTQIGWNGNLFMRGKKPSEKSSSEGSPSGYIYLNASASKYPLDINSHFAVAWNGALTISKNSISYSEQASEIIDKDDQRKNLYNLSSNEDKLINDVTNRIIYDESDKSVDAIKSYNNNQYDYSTIKDGFKGLYATPDGDMYLSRKLIIGSNFSATADGYLKAKSALFDDCNANVFQVRYLPPGGGDEKIDFKNSSIPPYKEQTSNKLKADYTIYGANIGSMGWLEGSRDNPNFNSKEEETEDNPKTLATYNLGFKSKAGCGIVLDSATNIRIDNDKEIGGTYFNGNILQMDMNQDINILQQSEKNGRIRIGSVGQILSRSREKIRFAIEPNYTGRNYGHNFEDTTEIKDNENGTSTTNYLYNTAFALDDKNIYLNYQDIVQTIIGIGNANQKDYYKFSVKTNPTTGDPYYRALTINKNGETIGTKMSSYSFDTDPNSTSAKFLLTIQGKNKEGVEQPKSFFKLYSSQTKSELSAGHGLLLQSTTGTKNPQIILGETVIGTEDEYRKGDSVIVKGGHLLVDDIPPENQKGIYARFA